MEPPLRDGILQTWTTILIQLSQNCWTRSLVGCKPYGGPILMSYETPRIGTLAPSFFSDCKLSINLSGNAIPDRASSKLTAFLVVFHAPRCQILGTNHRISPSVVTGKPTANPPSVLTTTTPLSRVKLSSLQRDKVARPKACSNFNHPHAWLQGTQDYTHPRSARV